MDVNKYEHSAAVMLEIGSAGCQNVATWINIIEVIHGDEECFFLLPNGKVVTGPEWCEQLSLPEQQQQHWQQLISVTDTKGVITKGMTISQVLGSTSTSHDFAQCNVPDATPASATSKDMASRQCTHATNTQLETAEHLGRHSVEADMSKAEPTITKAGVQPGNGAAVRVLQPLQQTNELERMTRDTQLQDTPAKILGNIATRGQPPETTRAAPHVTGSSLLMSEDDDVGRRQHDVSPQAVRVTVTNYNTHETVYALWTNADDVLGGYQGASPPGALFLPCTDATYQPAVGATHMKPAGLIKMACISGSGVNAPHKIRLNQRFKAKSGHCFYPGVSLAQVKSIVSSDYGRHNGSQWCFGLDWDESTLDPVANCSLVGPLLVHVMAINTINACAVYAQAKGTVEAGEFKYLFFVTDWHYNMKQPRQPVHIKQFLQPAKHDVLAASARHKAVFLTQHLQLPSGYVLPPGTSLHQVIEELDKLKSQESAAAAINVLQVAPRVLSQPSTDFDDVERRQHDSSPPAVRVTLTNYAKHETVYALWINVNDILQQHQTCPAAEALFLPCTDDTYQPAEDADPVNATGLARLASLPLTGDTKHRIRLNQRFKAATGHCFYPGMSLAQVMHAVSSNKEISQTSKGWETAVDPIVFCDTAEPPHIQVMAYYKNITRPLYAVARMTGSPATHKTITFVMCDSNYNVQQPEQQVSIFHLMGQASQLAERGELPRRNSAVFMSTNMFLTQGLQLPSGYILPPGTSLNQVLNDLNELKNLKDSDGDDGNTPAVGNTQPHFASIQSNGEAPYGRGTPATTAAPHVTGMPRPLRAADNADSRVQDVSRAVRVTMTNYDTHQTVYAHWTNAEAVRQRYQGSSRTQPLFLPCSDGSYESAVNTTHVTASGLAKSVLQAEVGSASHHIRLNQQWKAASGHCFYPGTSVAQVMSVMSSGRDTSHLMFGADWDDTAIASVVVCSTTEQACVRVMAFHSRTMCTVHGKVQLNVPPDRKEDTMLFICDSNYNVRKPGQLVALSCFLQEAGYSPYQSSYDQCTVVFTTQGLQLPSGDILPPGTSLQQVFEALDDMKSDSDAEDDADVLALAGTQLQDTVQQQEDILDEAPARRQQTPAALNSQDAPAGVNKNVSSQQQDAVVVPHKPNTSNVIVEVDTLNRHINPPAAAVTTPAQTQQQATDGDAANVIRVAKQIPATELDSQIDSRNDLLVVTDTRLQNTPCGVSTNVPVERQQTEAIICLSSGGGSDGNDVERAVAANGEVIVVMNNIAASKHQSVALITQSGSLRSQHDGAGPAAGQGADDVPAVISNALSKQDGPVLKQHAVPFNTGTGGKKRPTSSVDLQTDKPTRQKLCGHSFVTEQTRPDAHKQQGVKRRQENEACCDSDNVSTKQRPATADVQPFQPTLNNKANIVTGDMNVETGEPASAASTAVVQTNIPVQDNVQQHPTATVHIQQQVQADKPPPTLPMLNIKDESVHPLNVVAAWRAICSLLRYLGCSNDAVKKLWLTRQQWDEEGDEKVHHFAISYAELADAVEYTDWEYVKQILQEKFQLPV